VAHHGLGRRGRRRPCGAARRRHRRGIDSTIIERLFQPFAQADRTLDRTMAGSGSGWPSSRGCRAARGEVSVRSAGEGTGAEFVVHLRSIDHHHARRVAGAWLRARDPAHPDHRGQLRCAEALGMILELDGHEVESCTTASRASAPRASSSPISCCAISASPHEWLRRRARAEE